jgi:hypothetical protein
MELRQPLPFPECLEIIFSEVLFTLEADSHHSHARNPRPSLLQS